MKWLLSLLAPYRSQLFAMIGVIAVCGIGASVVGYLHIQRLNEKIDGQETQIDNLVQTNADWAKWAARQSALRALEQQNVLLLQDKLAVIEQRSSDMSAQIKELEASNAEVKEFMSRRIPADLRRLLEQK